MTLTHYCFRYVDIFSGICMLSSHGFLGLGSTRQGKLLLSSHNWHIWFSFRKNSQFVGLYFTLTFGLVIIYWLWFIYLKYGICETEASKEVVFQYQYPKLKFIVYSALWCSYVWDVPSMSSATAHNTILQTSRGLENSKWKRWRQDGLWHKFRLGQYNDLIWSLIDF